MTRFLTIIFMALLLFPACAKRGENLNTVATIGSHVLTRQELEKALRERLGEEPYMATPDLLSRLMDQVIEERLIYFKAMEEGFPADRPVNEIVTIYLEKQCEKIPEPGKDEVAAYTQAHRTQFKVPTSVVFRMILVKRSEDADAVKKAIKNGKPFEDLARKYSKAPNAARGGLEGPVALRHLPKELRDSLALLKEGAVSPVVQAPYGFLIFKLVQRLAARDLSPQEVYDDVVANLKQEACDALEKKIIKAMEKKEHVWIYPHHLPFPYSGSYALRPR